MNDLQELIFITLLTFVSGVQLGYLFGKRAGEKVGNRWLDRSKEIELR